MNDEERKIFWRNIVFYLGLLVLLGFAWYEAYRLLAWVYHHFGN